VGACVRALQRVELLSSMFLLEAGTALQLLQSRGFHTEELVGDLLEVGWRMGRRLVTNHLWLW
jgi:hypothetical protein